MKHISHYFKWEKLKCITDQFRASKDFLKMKPKQGKMPTNVTTIMLACKMCKTLLSNLTMEDKQGKQQLLSRGKWPPSRLAPLGSHDELSHHLHLTLMIYQLYLGRHSRLSLHIILL